MELLRSQVRDFSWKRVCQLSLLLLAINVPVFLVLSAQLQGSSEAQPQETTVVSIMPKTIVAEPPTAKVKTKRHE